MGEMRLKLKVPAKRGNKKKGIKKGDLVANPAIDKFEKLLRRQGIAYDAYFGISNKSLGEGDYFPDSHFLCDREKLGMEEARSSFVVWESALTKRGVPKSWNTIYYNDGKFNLKAQDQHDLVIFTY